MLTVTREIELLNNSLSPNNLDKDFCLKKRSIWALSCACVLSDWNGRGKLHKSKYCRRSTPKEKKLWALSKAMSVSIPTVTRLPNGASWHVLTCILKWKTNNIGFCQNRNNSVTVFSKKKLWCHKAPHVQATSLQKRATRSSNLVWRMHYAVLGGSMWQCVVT